MSHRFEITIRYLLACEQQANINQLDRFIAKKEKKENHAGLAMLVCPTYPIEQFGNRTQSKTNRLIAEMNRTQSNVRLPNDW